MESPACPVVPVSWGELLDKITILEIKQARICEPEARNNVAKELRLLQAVAAEAMYRRPIGLLVQSLKKVNEMLWETEDAIRGRELEGDFGPSFLCLARSVYKMNDQRAALKRKINAVLGSELVEEKSYASAGV